MTSFLDAYQPLFDEILLAIIFAFSQFVALRAGVFSIATAGLASIGAYTAAILTMQYGAAPWIGVGASLVAGTAVGILLALPLARLRGIYQAIATLAFVQIVISLGLYFEGVTGGALGLNSIPKTVGTWQLVVAVAVVTYVMAALSWTSIGRAFNAVRQDETVALSLGISVAKYHVLAFALSGAIAGVGGGLYAYHSYSLVPGQFGFSMVVAVLTAVVLGGRTSVAGPIVGAVLITLLPEVSRMLANQRYMLHGGLLVASMLYLPEGIVDSLLARWRAARGRRSAAAPKVLARS